MLCANVMVAVDRAEFGEACSKLVEMALNKAIEALSNQTEWVPANKRLPEKLKDVLVAFTDAPGEYDVAYMRKTFNGVYKGQGAENEWVSSMGETTYADYEISAWMHIPEYKDGE